MIVGISVCAAVCGLSVVALRRLHDVRDRARGFASVYSDPAARVALLRADAQLAKARAIGYAVLLLSVLTALLTTLTPGGVPPILAIGLVVCGVLFVLMARRAFDAQLHAAMGRGVARG